VLPTVGTPVVFTFNGTGGFTLAGNTNPPMDMSVEPPVALAGPPYAYTSGQKISVDGWEITLKGTPKVGDTVSVGNALDPQYSDIYKRNAGNASAMMDLRDVQMFDNVSLQDGWASAMSQVGTRTQSAEYAAKMSASIADNLENNLSAVSGVNLDEEAAKLIQFQQAYQASAKMLQTAQNIFDSLIQTVS
jgi:flagellar hook-associated protein 1 FlgK